MVLVSDWFPGHWTGINNETRAYRMIQERDPGLAPRFLAHVTENGSRVVGSCWSMRPTRARLSLRTWIGADLF